MTETPSASAQQRTYPPGVPCWVETPQPDPGAAAEFYGELFGWTMTNVGGDDVPYLIASLDGRDVAAISRAPDGAAGGPAWETYIAVSNADDAAAAVTAAGGRVTGGPFDAGETGRSVSCADPAGAAFLLWEAGSYPGAQLVNLPGSWNFSHLHAADQDQARQFYTAVFGWEFSQVNFGADSSWMVRMPGYADFLEVRNPGIRDRHAASGAPPGFTDAIGWLQPIASDAEAHWSVTLSVADADLVATRTAELGGTVVSGPVDVPYSRLVQITDPQGASVTLSQFKMPE